MKKTLVALVLVSSIAFAGVASAMGPCGNMGGCAPYTNLDPAVKEKVGKFYTETVDLRKQLSVKHGEKMALMRSEKPDAAAVGKLSGEIFDLHTTLHQKAVAAGVEQYVGHHGMGMGMGCGGQMGQGQMGGQGRMGHGCRMGNGSI